MTLPSITTVRTLLLPLACVATLTHCGEKAALDPSAEPPPELSATDEEKESADNSLPLLETVIRGVWQSTATDRLDSAPEKIQLDFRANGELTMIIYQKGQSQQEGTYTVKGNDLSLHIQGQDSDSVKTRFDGKTLTIIDVDREEEVDFQKL